MSQKKAMSMALTLVISIVVLIVVSLAVITITTGNVAKTGTQTGQTQDATFCQIALKSACASGAATYSCNGEELETAGQCGNSGSGDGPTVVD